ncbi:MAG: sigma-54-dependent transcriptional regulator [Bacteroidota bacterium]|jgi:two-component system nitrogen regulation response regulator NtrX
MPTVLIIDDERAIRNTLKEILEYENFRVEEAVDGKDALQKIEKLKLDLILCDIKMPGGMDGLELLQKFQKQIPETPVVMISGHGNIETAVEAVKKGAYDFIQKPLDLNRLLVTIRNAMDKSNLVSETKALKKKVFKTSEMIGESKAINGIKEIIEKVAPTDARVLITGANGSGKEMVARWIHEKSQRSAFPLIEVNCAAIPSELIESELFGHEKGAFTSAIATRKGKFEQAESGTLFLDEVGDMSLSAQAKVLRALQENKITKVGADKDIKVNVRVVAATNKDLKKEIENGNFREDLFHRLNVIPINVPSLDERKEDIPLLVNYFLKLICEEHGIATKNISADAVKQLQKYSWTGNIRELRNVIERLIILSDKTITEKDVLNFAGKV